MNTTKSKLKKQAQTRQSVEDEVLASILKLSQDTFNQDEENRRFIDESLKADKIRIDRQILEQQNREYEESLVLDREKALQKSKEKELPIDDVPKTREELRAARLRYFNSK